jgi:hypothetical protein
LLQHGPLFSCPIPAAAGMAQHSVPLPSGRHDHGLHLPCGNRRVDLGPRNQGEAIARGLRDK